MAQRAGDTRSMDEREAHLARVREVVRSWQRGEITVGQKRAYIADMNAVFYAQGVVGETGSDITKTPRVVDEVLLTLADRSLVPVEAAGAALDALRRAGQRASEAETPEEEAEIRAAGREAYEAILRSAR